MVLSHKETRTSGLGREERAGTGEWRSGVTKKFMDDHFPVNNLALFKIELTARHRKTDHNCAQVATTGKPFKGRHRHGIVALFSNSLTDSFKRSFQTFAIVNSRIEMLNRIQRAQC